MTSLHCDKQAMERKTVRKILISTGAVIGAGGAIIGVIRLADSGGNGSDGQIFNPSGSVATRTVEGIDGTVSPGQDPDIEFTPKPTPTRTATPTPGNGTVTPTAISTAQSPRPTGEATATPTPRPTDVWTPPGTIWKPEPTPLPTFPPTQPPTAEPTPVPTAQPTPEPTKPVVEGPKYEWANQLTNLINQERINNGLNGLNFNQSLSSAALAFAEFMIKNDVFAHGADGLQPWQRAEQYGYPSSGNVGEISAIGTSSSQGVMQGWLDSEPHHNKMLEPGWVDIGIGCYRGDFNGSFAAICVAEFGYQ